MSINCPRCGSPNIVTNGLDPIYIERAMQVAEVANGMGIRRIGLLAGLGTVGIRALNAIRKDNRCADCDYRFDNSDAGVAVSDA